MYPKISGKADKKSGKATKAIAKDNKKKRKESYAIYMYKVLKQVYPETDVSSKAMSIIYSIVNDLFDSIAGEATKREGLTVKKEADKKGEN